MQTQFQTSLFFEATSALGSDIIAGVTTISPNIAPYPFPTFGNETAHGTSIVSRSYQVLCSVLGVEQGALRTIRQVHGDTVTVLHRGEVHPDEGEADALITDDPGVILGIKIADCCAVLMYDPRRNVVAACHSGWRGSVQRIAVKVVMSMQERFGTLPSDVRVWLSPCASGRRYRVGDDVATLLPRSSVPLDDGGWLYDNIAEISCQLRVVGVRDIVTDGRCTIEDERFHSHRRMGNHAGRTLAIIGLRGAHSFTGMEVV